MASTNWLWYSKPGSAIPTTIVPGELDAKLEETILLLRWTNDLHAQIYFPWTPKMRTATAYLPKIKQRVADGDLVIAYRNGVDTLYFHYSRWLSDHNNGPGGPVWAVSHGLDPAHFPAASNSANDKSNCQNYIKNRLSDALTYFMQQMTLTCLYSIDVCPPDLNPTDHTRDRQIRRLQAHGNKDEWTAGAPQEYHGTDRCHRYWGHYDNSDGEWHFWLTEIS
jgi:hypothetical protein